MERLFKTRQGRRQRGRVRGLREPRRGLAHLPRLKAGFAPTERRDSHRRNVGIRTDGTSGFVPTERRDSYRRNVGIRTDGADNIKPRDPAAAYPPPRGPREYLKGPREYPKGPREYPRGPREYPKSPLNTQKD